jgi:hypothetical protein
LALVIVRRVLGVLGCAPTPDADAVEIAVLRHQLNALDPDLAVTKYRQQMFRRPDPVVVSPRC